MALRNRNHEQVKRFLFLARLRLSELLEPCAVRVERTVLRGGKFSEESTYPNWVNECILRSLALEKA